jgi:hypothetical protein
MLLAFCPRALFAQAAARHEIVAGRVTSDSARALAGADVIVTRAPDFAFKSAKTDVAGRFSVDWPDGSGTYLVHVSAAGYTPVTKRVTRAGADSVIAADVALVAVGTVARLAPVVTRAQAPRPDRNPPGGVDVGAVEAMQGSYRRVPPDLAGDLATITGMAPGVMTTSGGISVLGLAPSQNSVTLNGMALAGATIPRGISARVRLSTATYDPANGWFSGARTNVQLGPASEVFKRGDVAIAADAPAFQSNDPVSSRLGQRFATLNGNVDAIGTAFDDRLSYNYALQGSRRSADVTSLLGADAFLLQHAGVSVDSAARFTQLMQGARVPVTAAGIPSQALTDNVVFLGRFDHAPYDWKTLTPARTTWGLTTYANWTRNEGQGIAPTGTPAHAGQSSQGVMGAQAEYSTFFGHDYLADVRSGLTYSRNTSEPYLQLPDGRVLVSSTFTDATSGVSTLQFGGNGAMHNDTRAWTWESIGELQFYPQGFARHRIKLTSDARFDAFSQDVQGNRLGTFSYNSLADLAANRPASFTRTLDAPERRGGEWNAFASVGDLWRAAPNLQILYGARLEGNRFVDVPQFNPAVESALGARTDRVPNTVALLPRAGFTLQRAAGAGIPAGTIRGGTGAFRNLLDPALLSNASVSTGLPGALQRISCIGSAVPTPDWSAFAADPLSIPRQCAGTTTASFADAAPNVSLFDPSFDPSKSWRSNLSWSSGLWGRTAYTVEGVYSLNVSQPGTTDLNFAGVPRFTLSDEGRPMFVNSSSIVPATGAVSPVDARRSAAFGRVVEGVSDLRSESRQLLFSIRPDLGPMLSPILRDPSFAYVLSSIRAQQRGFSGSTFGDPNDRQWGRGDNLARHQFVAQFIVWPRGTRPGPGLFFYGHLQSGTPFTPLVGGDVNGDGVANDRAFVFDPARATDPAFATAMRSLLGGSSRTTRACLERQLGASAARNSCEGPWTAALNMNLALPGIALGERFRRFNFGLNFTNPLGGLDQLLHGSDNLRGWGTPATPDPVLYTVRGFDPATNRFRYEVNPRFGTTSPSINTLRAPFRVSLDMNIDIAPSLPSQQIDHWLTPGRRGHPGTKLSVAELVQRLQRTVPDPYAPLLAQSDSLLLTREQLDQVQRLAAHHRVQMDSIYTSISTWLAALPDRFDAGEATARSDEAQQRALEITRVEVRERLPEILTPVQLTLLPGLTNYFYKAVQPVRERFFIP